MQTKLHKPHFKIFVHFEINVSNFLIVEYFVKSYLAIPLANSTYFK